MQESTTRMRICVVVPVLNEETALKRLLPLLIDASDEILVVDGGSADRSGEVAQGLGARVVQANPGRGRQMNVGARAATGDVFWFLHADSIPPAAWREKIVEALSDPHVVGGGFRTRIDAAGAGYRLLDLWGRIRWACTKIFYGDQGIFVRRGAFERIGGFPDWPVLEDLGFCERLKKEGKVRLLAGPLKTSARRWQTHGFWRTVFYHSFLVFSYSWGFSRPPSPAPRPVLIILAKAPLPGQVKTRLLPSLTPEQAADLAQRLLQETVTLAQRLGKEVQLLVAVAPPEGIAQVQNLLKEAVPVVAQQDGDLGARISGVFDHSFSQGAQAVLVLGADHPGLPLVYLKQALAILRKEPDPVVLGPTEDGGYYLVGLKKPHPELFQEVPWSTDRVLQVTQEKARSSGLSVRLLPPWFDVDRPADLSRYPGRPS